MGARIIPFQVRVIPKNTHPEYISKDGYYSDEDGALVVHIERRTHKQARKAAKKYGRPISVQKMDVVDVIGHIENLNIQNEVYCDPNPYPSAIAMDEMIFNKRNKRRANMHRDKNGR